MVGTAPLFTIQNGSGIRTGWLIGVLILLLLFPSCTFDYRSAMVEENLSEEIPTSVLLNFNQTIVKNGRIILEAEAERAEIYDALDKTVIQGLFFAEYGREGEKLTEGRAENGVYYNDSENAEFSGNVYLYSITEETGIRTENLTWDNEKRLLTTPTETTVTIERDDGSRLEGQGLEADLRLRKIVLNRGVSGTYYTEEGEE